MMPKQLAHTSPGSVLSLRGSTPGSPAAIVARLTDGVIGYKALAALPREKAILDIERPDLMMYEPRCSYSPLQRSWSPRSLSPPPSPEESKEYRETLEMRSSGSSPCSTLTSRTHSTHTPTTPTTPSAAPTSQSHQTHAAAKSAKLHFHRPENGSNIYRKPPIYRQSGSVTDTTAPPAGPQGKHMEDLIIESSKFPAAQRPDPNQPSKIETDHWPCPPSVAVIEKESRSRLQTSEEEEQEEEQEEEHLTWSTRALQNQAVNKVQSNLGKILLKEEVGRCAPPLRRKTRSLPDKGSTSRSPYFPASSRSGLCSERLQSAVESATGLQNGEVQLKERGTSLPNVLEHKVYPYQLLVLTQHGRNKLPPDVDRTRLESYLSQQEFLSVFGMCEQDFLSLSLWRRNELKKKFGLF